MTLGLLEGFESCFLCELRVHLLVISTLIPYFSLFIVNYGFVICLLLWIPMQVKK